MEKISEVSEKIDEPTTKENISKISRIGPRNSTSFQNNLFEALKDIRKDKKDFLLYHHRLVHEYILKYDDIRGMLLYHPTGTGKSVLGADLGHHLLQKKGWKVIFVSTKSLHDNFRENLHKYYHMDPELRRKFTSNESISENISQHYKFVSLNASNLIDQIVKGVSGIKEDFVKSVSLDDHIIIIDEAHNFVNAVAGGSKNAVGLYDMLMRSQRIKVLFLTATPCVNDVFEATVYFNILAGFQYDKYGEKHTLFDEDYDSFVKYFISGPENFEDSHQLASIKNKNKISDRILGFVSFYKIGKSLQERMPTKLKIVISRVKMSPEQYGEYLFWRDKETKEVRFHSKTKSTRFASSLEISSTYRVRTRQISNFLYPSEATEHYKDERGYSRYRFNISKIPEEMWKDLEFLKIHSPKLFRTLQFVSLHLSKGILDKFRPTGTDLEEIITVRTSENKDYLSTVGMTKWTPGIGRGYIYSQFLDFGLHIMLKIFQGQGMKEIKNADMARDNPAEKHGTFAIISGEIDQETRSKLIKIYNQPGVPKINILLISSTGMEGISLKRSRFACIFEPYWNWLRIEQIFARGLRLDGHMDLPAKDRNMMPYIFLADYPTTDLAELEKMQKDAEKKWLNRETETETKIQTETETKTKTKTENKTGTENETRTENETKTETKTEIETKTENQPKTESENQPKILDEDNGILGANQITKKKEVLDKRQLLEPTTDIALYNLASGKQILINSMYRILEQSSIDCMFNDGRQCRICSPTNKKLWSTNLDADIKMPSLCIPIVKEKIIAQTILIDNIEYAYQIVNEHIIIYEFVESADAYKEMDSTNEKYEKILEAISSKNMKKKRIKK